MLFAKRAFSAACRYLGSRSFCYPLFLIAVTTVLFHVVTDISAVRVIDGTQEALLYTTRQQVDSIIDQTDIRAPSRFDRVRRDGVDGYFELTLERAFPIYLTVDGGTRCIMTTAMALDEMLVEQDISLGEYDRVNMSLRQMLQSGDRIVIQLVEQRLTEEEQPIPFTQRQKFTSLLRLGRTRILQEGKDGTEVLTYRETTVDGVVQDRELLATDIIREPVEQVTLVGDGSAISNYDYSDEYPLDANGIPLHYQALFRGQVATGYWSRTPRGASGTRCTAGTVAVRSSQFPYGTKLYVRTEDGSFIYGYCVSNDTGTGLIQGIIDIDLFYDTYLESVLNSRRIVDIYVLEYSAPPTSGAISR